MAEHFRDKFSFIGRVWCRTMHKRAMWPIHGEYECSTCLRRYPVPWEKESAPEAVRIARPENAPSAAWRHHASTLRG